MTDTTKTDLSALCRELAVALEKIRGHEPGQPNHTNADDCLMEAHAIADAALAKAREQGVKP